MKNKFESNSSGLPESSEKKSGYEISGESIERALTSPDFEKVLRKTLAQVIKHRREFGFLIGKEMTADKFHYSKPIGDLEESSTALPGAYEEMEANLESRGLDREDWIELGDFHFHGYESLESRVIYLSSGDIGYTSSARKANRGYNNFDIPSIGMIANAVSSTGVEALVYQEPLAYSPSDKPAIFEEIKETLMELRATNASQEEVLEALRHYGYQAGMVHFSDGKLSEEDKKFIRSLGMVAKKTPIDTRDLL